MPLSQKSCWISQLKDWATMSEKEKSTLRAVAAVGQQECKGYLDCVNFYDNCRRSMFVM
jgi:hypothetical protein